MKKSTFLTAFAVLLVAASGLQYCKSKYDVILESTDLDLK